MKLRQLFIENKGSQEGKEWLTKHRIIYNDDKLKSIDGNDDDGYIINMNGGPFQLDLGLGTGGTNIPFKINKVIGGGFSVHGQVSTLENFPPEVSGPININDSINSITNYKIKCKRFSCPAEQITTLNNCLIESEQGILLRSPRRIDIGNFNGNLVVSGEKKNNEIQLIGDLDNLNKLGIVGITPELFHSDIVNLVCFRHNHLSFSNNMTPPQMIQDIVDNKDSIFKTGNADLDRSFSSHAGKGMKGALALIDELYNQGFRNFL